MGVYESISADRWPQQGPLLGQRCRVIFHYDSSRAFLGTIVRSDHEAPSRTIIRLDDGRTVLADECQYAPGESWPLSSTRGES